MQGMMLSLKTSTLRLKMETLGIILKNDNLSQIANYYDGLQGEYSGMSKLLLGQLLAEEDETPNWTSPIDLPGKTAGWEEQDEQVAKRA